MFLPRIALFNRQISSRSTHISLDPIFHLGFYSVFVVNPSPFFLTKGVSSLPAGDSKLAKPKSLSSIFANPSQNLQAKTPTIRNELSLGAALLLKRLQEDLYLKLEPGLIPVNLPSRQLINSAAEKLGQRHQEIAKWLSGSDLKKVALFGCPSIDRKTVFASKRLRSFFYIQEDIICRGCKLKASCKFVNQRVMYKVNRVILTDVMRLLTILAFDAVPQQLSVPADIKHSVDKLLKETVNLSA